MKLNFGTFFISSLLLSHTSMAGISDGMEQSYQSGYESGTRNCQVEHKFAPGTQVCGLATDGNYYKGVVLRLNSSSFRNTTYVVSAVVQFTSANDKTLENPAVSTWDLSSLNPC